jgi:(2Fe-2S) ferredoxin
VECKAPVKLAKASGDRMVRAMLAVGIPPAPELDNSFDLTGKFLGFTNLDSYQLKYLRLEVEGQIYLIKIPKEQRLTLYKTLQAGTVINCQGQCKDGTKYKAARITPVDMPSNAVAETLVKVLVCGKSDCLRQGSQQIAQAFAQFPHVRVQITGCQKKCKQAPNLLVNAPQGKASYSRVTITQVAQIMAGLLEVSGQDIAQ